MHVLVFEPDRADRVPRVDSGARLFQRDILRMIPLFLPELFVTRVRSVGAGVCFNFGRIITAIKVFVTAGLIAYLDNDFRQIGRVTSLIYLFGAVEILLMPKGVEGKIKD